MTLPVSSATSRIGQRGPCRFSSPARSPSPDCPADAKLQRRCSPVRACPAPPIPLSSPPYLIDSGGYTPPSLTVFGSVRRTADSVTQSSTAPAAPSGSFIAPAPPVSTSSTAPALSGNFISPAPPVRTSCTPWADSATASSISRPSSGNVAALRAPVGALCSPRSNVVTVSSSPLVSPGSFDSTAAGARGSCNSRAGSVTRRSLSPTISGNRIPLATASGTSSSSRAAPVRQSSIAPAGSESVISQAASVRWLHSPRADPGVLTPTGIHRTSSSPQTISTTFPPTGNVIAPAAVARASSTPQENSVTATSTSRAGSVNITPLADAARTLSSPQVGSVTVPSTPRVSSGNVTRSSCSPRASSLRSMALSAELYMTGKPIKSSTKLLHADAEWQKIACQYTPKSLPSQEQTKCCTLSKSDRDSIAAFRGAEESVGTRGRLLSVEQGAAHQKLNDIYPNGHVGPSASSTAEPRSSRSSSMTRIGSPQTTGMTTGSMTPRKASNDTRWVSTMPNTSKTSLLKALGRDLTEIAAKGELDPVIGRDTETELMIQVLALRRKNNPLLIGEPGVGKTAVVEGLAQRIVSGDVPDKMREKHIIQIEVATLLAGTQNRGEFEERMAAVLDEAVASCDHVILFIDEIHTIIGAGRSGRSSSTVDAAAIMKPVLARGEFQCIGATTLEDYRVHFEKDASLERRFHPITVKPTNINDTFLILLGLAPKYEAHHNVQYSEEALKACVKLAAEYMPDRFLPDKAIDIFDEVGAFVQLRHQDRTNAAAKQGEEANNFHGIMDTVKFNESALRRMSEEASRTRVKDDAPIEIAALSSECQRLKSELMNSLALIQEFEDSVSGAQSKSVVVTEDDVARVISRMTGIPLEKLSEDESMRMLNLEAELSQRIVGQGSAIAAVSKALRRARVGLKSPNRPIASFLFCGPTGVGKTELCKALAEVYFGQANALIRLDMSEFMEMHSVSKLIGSPPGYIGYGDENQLTDRIRRKPYALLLLDEIEKAHSAVLNIMLQIMDDGCLTDATGRNVSFRNALLIMTSNAYHLSNGFGAIFSPEFLNRLDGVIPFSPLGKNEVGDIAELELAKTVKRVRERGASLTLSEAFKDKVVDQGFDVADGARPLRRAVAELLEDQLANDLLVQPLSVGEHVHVDVDSDQEVVVSRPSSPAPSTAARTQTSSEDVRNPNLRRGSNGIDIRRTASLSVPTGQR